MQRYTASQDVKSSSIRARESPGVAAGNFQVLNLGEQIMILCFRFLFL